MHEYLRRRRRRRAETLARASAALADLPTLGRHSREVSRFVVRALVDARAKVVEAHHLARRRSAARALLREAYRWVDTWLRARESGDVTATQLVVLYGQLVWHLKHLARRLSVVARIDTYRL